MGAVRGQLARLGAGTAAEFRVVLVRAVLRFHDQFAVGEKAIIDAIWMHVHS